MFIQSCCVLLKILFARPAREAVVYHVLRSVTDLQALEVS